MLRHSIENAINSPLLQTVGKTPVIEIDHPLIPKGKSLLLKLEYVNPTFSIKDRTAYGLVSKAIERGDLKTGGMIIESSSGNLGKSLAMISAVLGMRMIVVVDSKVSQHNLNWFRAYGAEIEVVTEKGKHGSLQRARIARVQELLRENPDAYWPNQYENRDNVDYHCEYTAQEFLDEDFDCLVGCLSTGGHLTGIAKAMRKHAPERKIMACDVVGSAIFGLPFQPYLLNGVGLAWRTENTDTELFDYLMSISDSEAISTCKIIARDCGLLLGGSAGLNIFGALYLLRRTEALRVMAIVPDAGFNYLEQFYDDSWVKEKGVRILTESGLVQAIDVIDKHTHESLFAEGLT